MSTFIPAKSADALYSLTDGYSFTTSYVSDGYLVEFPKAICIALVVSAGSSPVGTLDAEGSLDGSHWFSLQALVGGTAKAVNANGTYALNYSGLAVRWVRANVVRSSGTGTISVKLSVV